MYDYLIVQSMALIANCEVFLVTPDQGCWMSKHFKNTYTKLEKHTIGKYRNGGKFKSLVRSLKNSRFLKKVDSTYFYSGCLLKINK